MLDARPLFVNRLFRVVRVDNALEQEVRLAQPRLFLVLDHRPKFLPVLAAGAGDDGRVAYGHIERSSQQPVHGCNRVGDVIHLPYTRVARYADEYAFVKSAGRHAKRRAGHLGGDLVNTRQLQVPTGAGREVRRDRRMMRDLLREVYDPDPWLVGSGLISLEEVRGSRGLVTREAEI